MSILTIDFNSIANQFTKYFNNRIFSNQEETQLFNDVNTDVWWMSGDETVFKFAGSRSIKERISNQFPIVKGFDVWSFMATDIIIDKENYKIMLEIDCKGIGYGNKSYSNNYLFILSINQEGKIYSIREYLDANSVLQYSLNNLFITQQFNNLNNN
ncbi:hypothetical protein DICPUDRAFT_87219 [Dictyostelium purpureum]|uniref:SnoaL-like domain-containing protein n=1 Tax=Dictyostelium purpureum TaxID=5786 RepID=F0ZGR7_DICPU|nr:uncharacterized protein DICPUDRAFT_87219 [Dictyostelium purpureum]EGC36872.1 hypothetical protein DICPUDRAFT_87219 [Dictyostelium purpureum]|eukprot:XP_003286594.1 hypothetical protein DICPUDRAFT_87219 [Dictyostelium purpureum]